MYQEINFDKSIDLGLVGVHPTIAEKTKEFLYPCMDELQKEYPKAKFYCVKIDKYYFAYADQIYHRYKLVKAYKTELANDYPKLIEDAKEEFRKRMDLLNTEMRQKQYVINESEKMINNA